MVCRCGDNTDPDVQLTVIKTLLTVTTAEHFRVHGDCLVQVLCAPLLSVLLHRITSAHQTDADIRYERFRNEHFTIISVH